MPRPTFKKSIVWEFFTITDDKKSVICKLCQKSLINHNNTSNYRDHLKRLHPIQLNLEEERRGVPSGTTNNVQVPNTSSVASVADNQNQDRAGTHQAEVSNTLRAADGNVRRKRQLRLYGTTQTTHLTAEKTSELDEAVLEMIVLDYQPLSIVEDTGFKKLINKLNTNYSLPSRKTLSEKILPAYYNRTKEELKCSIHKADYISLTSDYWKAINDRTYLSVTAHYITEHKIHSNTLATTEIIDTHSSTNTGASIVDVCDDYGIFDKIVTVVTDNAANMRKAVNDIGKHHHPCVAHTLNLTVKDSIDADPMLLNLIAKCRAIVSYFRQSSVAAYKLRLKQKELNLNELVLKQDVVTRWNSTYTMLERLIAVKQPLCLALMDLDRAPDNLSSHEWTTLKDILPILKPFSQLTEEISGDRYVTMSMIVPLIRGLKYSLRMITPITSIGQELQKNSQNFVYRRLGSLETNKFVAKATFLDPRFKKTGFGHDDHATNAQQWVTDELAGLAAPIATVVHSSTSSDHHQPNPPNTESSLWLFFDEKATQQRSYNSPIANALVMIRQYTEIPLVDRREDPLKFWHDHSKTFPGLFRLATKYLSIPATSVPSERLFSKAGYVLQERRNRLKSKKLNEIIFLNQNLRKN